MTFLSVKARCNLNVNKENNVCKIVTKHCLTWNARQKNLSAISPLVPLGKIQ